MNLRNRISALKSRVSKKLEVARYTEQIITFKTQLKLMLEAMNEKMSDETKSKILDEI